MKSRAWRCDAVPTRAKSRLAGIGFGWDTHLQPFPEPMPVKVEPTPPLASLSPVAGKAILARFDGGQLSSDAGVLLLREVEQRLGIAERLAACLSGSAMRSPTFCAFGC